MFRRTTVTLLCLWVLLGAAGATAAEEGCPLLTVREAAQQLRITLRRTSHERIGLMLRLGEERAEEALRYANQGLEDRARWAIGSLARLMENLQLEARRGQERGEDLTEAMAALEGAASRIGNLLPALLERLPPQAQAAVHDTARLAERAGQVAVEVLERIAAGELPGRAQAARELLDAVGQRGQPSGSGKSPSPGPGGR